LGRSHEGREKDAAEQENGIRKLHVGALHRENHATLERRIADPTEADSVCHRDFTFALEIFCTSLRFSGSFPSRP
jgi:hypothetical protein